MTTESTLKIKLVSYLREHLRGYVILRHEDRWTAGIPDMSVTGYGRTSWWEVKHANPYFQSRGIQELTMLRLATAGRAFHIVYAEKKGIKQTRIVHPKQIAHWDFEGQFSTGFDHKFVADFIRQVHEP